jgi:hypothetical protein
MKNLTFLLFICFFSLSSCSKAIGASCSSIVDIQNSHKKLWIERTKASHDSLLNCIEKAWIIYDQSKTQSAEFNYFATIYLLSAMQFDTLNFFTKIENNTQMTSKTMKNIKYNAFVWRDDLPCGYSGQLNQIKSILEVHKIILQKNTAFIKIRALFEQLECSVVD